MAPSRRRSVRAPPGGSLGTDDAGGSGTHARRWRHAACPSPGSALGALAGHRLGRPAELGNARDRGLSALRRDRRLPPRRSPVREFVFADTWAPARTRLTKDRPQVAGSEKNLRRLGVRVSGDFRRPAWQRDLLTGSERALTRRPVLRPGSIPLRSRHETTGRSSSRSTTATGSCPKRAEPCEHRRNLTARRRPCASIEPVHRRVERVRVPQNMAPEEGFEGATLSAGMTSDPRFSSAVALLVRTRANAVAPGV